MNLLESDDYKGPFVGKLRENLCPSGEGAHLELALAKTENY